MPTWATVPAFVRQFQKLDASDRKAFLDAKSLFAKELNEGKTEAGFSAALRIHKLSGKNGVWSLSFGSDRRATFRYGEQQREGLVHIEWLAIGDHSIYN